MKDDISDSIRVLLESICDNTRSDILKKNALKMIEDCEKTVEESSKNNSVSIDKIDAVNLVFILLNAQLFDNNDAKVISVEDIKRFRTCIYKARNILNNYMIYQIHRFDNIIKDMSNNAGSDFDIDLEKLSKEELIKYIRERK